MKKTFTKFFAALALLAFFIPSFIAVGQTTVDVSLSSGSFSDNVITWTCADGNITIQQIKGSSSTNPNSSYISAPRVYKQNILSFVATNGYAITNIDIKYNGAYNGTTKYAGTEISNNNVDNNTSALTPTWSTANGGTHTIATVSSDGLSEIYIQNGHSSDATTQLRITGITITYKITASVTATTVTIDDSGITNTDIYTGTTAGSLAASVTETVSGDAVSGATVTWSSSNTDVATIDATGAVTLVAVGTTTITASYAGVSGTYGSSSATYELTVTSTEPYVQPTTIEITPNYTFWGKTGQFSGSTYSELSGSQDNVTLDWTRGEGSTYANSTAMRFYKDNTLTFTAPTGYEIKSIVLTVTGTYSDLSFSPAGFDSETTTWTGSSTTVTMTRPSNASSYAQISKYVITIGTASSAVATTTTITVPSGFNTDLHNGTNAGTLTASVTETEGGAAVSGATVTWSSSNSSVASIASNGAVTLVAVGTTTITASYAGVEDEYQASSATYEFTVTDSSPLANIAALTAKTAGDYNVALTNALVTYVNGTNAYIEDASGAIMLYHCAGDLLAGDKITGTASVTYTVYNNLPEVTAITLAEGYTITHNNTVTPAVVTIAELNANITSYISRYVKIENATVTSAFSNRNSTIEQSGSSIVLRDQNNPGTLTTTANSTVTVTAHPSIYNTTNQIAVYEQSQIVEAQNPYINASNVNITCDATSGNITYTIEHEPSPAGTLTATVVAGYTISNLSLGEPANGTITFTCDANTTSTAHTAEVTLAYTYGGSKAQVTKTVTITQAAYVPTPTNDPFVRISSLADLTDGSIVVIAARYNGSATEYKAMPSTMSSGKPDGYGFTSATSGNYEILPAAIINNINGYYWVVNISGGNYSFKNANGDLISYGSSGTDFTTNGAKTSWSIERETSAETALVGEYTGFVITNVTTNTRGFACNGSVFGAYATSNMATSGYNFFLDFFVQTEVPTTATYYYSVNGTLSEAHTCAVGSTKTLDAGTDLYSNFVFAGWTTDANDVSQHLTSYTFPDDTPVTFYANYSHTVTGIGTKYYTRVLNETATSDIQLIGPSIIPSFGILNMATYEIDNESGSPTVPYLVIEEGGQFIYQGEDIKSEIQKHINAPLGTWGQDDNTGWYALSSPVGRVSKLSEVDSLQLNPYDPDMRHFDFFAYSEKCGWYNKKDGEYLRRIDAGVGYLYAREESTTVLFRDYSNRDDVDLTNLTYTSSRGTLAGLHCIGNPYTHNIYKGVGITGDMQANYYALNEATGAWISTTDATAIVPMQAILVFVNKTDGTAAIHMTSDNSAPSKKANDDYIKFNVANSKYEDVAYAWFDNGESLNKIIHRNSEVPMLYIPQNDGNYSIAYMSDNTEMFNLNFKAMTAGKYTLSVSEKGDFSYLHVYDRLTGEDVDMLLDSYTFIGSPVDNEARFIVRLSYNASTTGSETFAFQNGSDVIVNGNGELQVFDLTGRMVMNTTVNGIQAVSMPQGVYVLRMIGENVQTQKIVVR